MQSAQVQKRHHKEAIDIVFSIVDFEQVNTHLKIKIKPLITMPFLQIIVHHLVKIAS